MTANDGLSDFQKRTGRRPSTSQRWSLPRRWAGRVHADCLSDRHSVGAGSRAVPSPSPARSAVGGRVDLPGEAQQLRPPSNTVLPRRWGRPGAKHRRQRDFSTETFEPRTVGPFGALRHHAKRPLSLMPSNRNWTARAARRIPSTRDTT